MNKVYQVVWSKVRNCYVVVSELAKKCTKSCKFIKFSRSLVVGVLLCVLSCGAVVPTTFAYTYNNQTTTVSALQADANTTTITNNSNVTVNGNIDLPTAGGNRIILNIEDHDYDFMEARDNGGGMSPRYTYHLEATYSAEQMRQVAALFYNGNYTVYNHVSGEIYSVECFGQTFNVTLEPRIDPRQYGSDKATITLGHPAYFQYVEYAPRSTIEGLSSQNGVPSSPDLAVTSNSKLNASGGNITLTGGTLTANGASTASASGDIKANSITASNGSTVSADNITTTSGDLDATGSDVNATGTVQSAGVVKAGKLNAGTLLGAGSGMSSLGGGLTVAGQVKGVTAGTANTDAVNLKQMKDYVGTNAIKSLSTNGSVLTYTKADGTTGTVSTSAKYVGINSSNGTNQTGEGAVATDSITIGKNATAIKTDSVAIGLDSYADEANTISVGHSKTMLNSSGVPIDPDTLQPYENPSSVTLFDSALTRRITNVAPGVRSNDAVNYGQLIALQGGTVTSGNTQLISGNTAYNELRPADGQFIRRTNTTAQNLSSLDTMGKNAVKSMTVDGNMLVYTRGDNTSVSIDLPSTGANVPSPLTRFTGQGVTTTVGSVTAFASNSTPTGYLLCDGRAVSRTEYANLFRKIGTTYGAGDGSTTFNLPNLVGRFVEGSQSSGQYINAGLPNITGMFNNEGQYGGVTGAGATGGAFYTQPSSRGHLASDIDPTNSDYYFDASRSSSIYGNSNTVQPDSLMMQYYIKTDDEFNGSRYMGVNSDSGSFNEFGEGATGTDAIAIGRNTSSKGISSVAIGTDSVASASDVISVGHAATDINPVTNTAYGSDLNRRIVNVADGVDDHDVSTMGQLNAEAEARRTADNALSRRINQEATARQNNDVRLENMIGHMAENGNYIEADVPVSTNLYTLDNQIYEASQQLQREIAVREEAEQKIYNKIGFLEEDTDLLGSTDTVYENLQRLESAIKANSATLDNAVVYTNNTYNRVNFAGSNGTVLNNVKAGMLSEDSLQAVNGSQLYATNKNIEGFAADINRNKQSIRDLNQSVSTALESVSSSSLLVDTINDLKADSSLNNLTLAGKQVIQTAAANAVQEYMAKNASVMSPMAPMMSLNPNTLHVTDAGNGSLHVGQGSSVNGTSSIAIGVGNQVNANNSGAFGDPSVINADESYVLGNDDTINTGATGSFLIGNDSVSDAKGGLSLGSNNTLESTAEDTVLLGNHASATGKNSVVLGSHSVANEDNVVSLGNGVLKRKIVNMMDGTLSDTSAEAVTGKQLYDTNQKVSALEGSMAAKADVSASNIDVAAWTDKLATGRVESGNGGLVTGGEVYNAVSTAANEVLNYSLVKTDGSNIFIGRDVGGQFISVANADGDPRIITGVATNPEDASSAANVGYVNAVGDAVLGVMNASLERADTKINRVGANAAAMSALTPASFEGDERWSLAASVGNYRSETAGAVGAFYKPAENVMMNVRGSFGNDENMVAAGVAVSLNKGDVPGVTKRQLVQRINVMGQTMEAMRNEMAQMAETIRVLKEKSNS